MSDCVEMPNAMEVEEAANNTEVLPLTEMNDDVKSGRGVYEITDSVANCEDNVTEELKEIEVIIKTTERNADETESKGVEDEETITKCAEPTISQKSSANQVMPSADVSLVMEPTQDNVSLHLSQETIQESVTETTQIARSRHSSVTETTQDKAHVQASPDTKVNQQKASVQHLLVTETTQVNWALPVSQPMESTQPMVSVPVNESAFGSKLIEVPAGGNEDEDVATSASNVQVPGSATVSRSPYPVERSSTVTSSMEPTPSAPTVDSSIVVPFVGRYEMELAPSGFLHGVFGFPLAASKYFNKLLSPQPKSPVLQVLNMLSPKLEDLSNQRRFKLENFDLQFLSVLGRGSFGEVYHQTYRKTEKVAMKRFRSYADPRAIYKEAHILIAVQHPRVVKLYGVFHERGTWLVMEPCLGNLRNFLGALTGKQKIRFGLQILEGLQHLHSLNFIHCDIKPDNVFITRQNNAVIGDFGNAQVLKKESQHVRIGREDPCLGAPGYSDALANNKIYSKASDVFGAGCTLYEMDTGVPLMRYPNWPDVPITEYIRVVKVGRLINVGVSPVNENGKRDRLVNRCRSSVLFKFLLPEMVKHAPQRLEVTEILEVYHEKFTRLLEAQGSSWEMLDADTNLGDISLQRSILKEPIKPKACSDDVNVAMHFIYYDSKLSLDETDVTELREEFPVVRTVELQQMIDQFIKARSIRVFEPVNDLGEPESSDVRSALQRARSIASDKTLQSVEKPTCSVARKDLGTGGNKGSVTEQDSKMIPNRSAKPPSTVIVAAHDSNPSSSTASTSQNKDEGGTTSRKRKHQENMLSNVTEQTARSDVQCTKKQKNGSKLPKSKDVSKTKETVSTKQTEVPSKVVLDTAVTDIEYFITRGLWVPTKLRGKPPSPVNLTEAIKKKLAARPKWNGWFECKKPCSLYTHDYKKFERHTSVCPHFQKKKD